MTTGAGKEGLPGQGLSQIQAIRGDTVVTKFQVTQTTTHQKTGGDVEPVLFTTPQIKLGDQTGKVDSRIGELKSGDKKVKKPRARLVDPATGEPLLPTRMEEKVRGALERERKEKREERRAARNAELRKEQGQALVNLLTNVIESKKLAEKEKNNPELTEEEWQQELKKLADRYPTQEEQEAKKTKLQIEKSIKRHSAKEAKNQAWLQRREAKEARRLELENNRKAKETKEVNRMKERVIVIKKFVKKEKDKIVGGILAAAIIGSAIGGAYFYPRPEGNNAIVTPATPTPSGTGEPTPTLINETPTPVADGKANGSDVMAITSLPARPDANVNGVYIGLGVRDTDTSVRPLFYNETGVNKTQPYTLNLPTGWSAITASVSATVQRQGGIEKSYEKTPEIVVKGPFSGRIVLFEGALRIVPSEWTDKISGEVLDIQRQQTKNPNLQVTVFSDK